MGPLTVFTCFEICNSRLNGSLYVLDLPAVPANGVDMIYVNHKVKCSDLIEFPVPFVHGSG